MRFRSLRHPIRISLTDGGHTAVIDTDWRELDKIFHGPALAAGAECDADHIQVEDVDIKDSAEAAGRPASHDDVIRSAIEVMLKRNEDGDFTADDLPNTNVVNNVSAMKFKKEDVLRVFRAMQAEAAELADNEEG